MSLFEYKKAERFFRSAFFQGLWKIVQIGQTEPKDNKQK